MHLHVNLKCLKLLLGTNRHRRDKEQFFPKNLTKNKKETKILIINLSCHVGRLSWARNRLGSIRTHLCLGGA